MLAKIKSYFWKGQPKPIVSTPTVRYFIEKTKGTSDLSEFEKAALEYIAHRTPETPADYYFTMKRFMSASQKTYSLQLTILDHHEKEAMRYVEEYFPQKESIGLRK